MDFEPLEFGSCSIQNIKPQYREIDICGLVNKMKSKSRTMMNIPNEKCQLSALIENPPKNNECFKMISVGGGFSSLSIIAYIAELETIDEMYVSTFRIGKKHFQTLCRLKTKGQIGTCHFLTSQSQEKIDETMTYKGKKYNYYQYICETCDELGWKIKSFDNHSKLLLLKTPANNYVIETSSNLNENPKMEQFSWENDRELFDWYKKLFIELLSDQE